MCCKVRFYHTNADAKEDFHMANVMMIIIMRQFKGKVGEALSQRQI